MTEAEFLHRMDRNTEVIRDHVEASREHMKRGNELMEEVREEMRLNREEARLNREEAKRGREAFADLRTFTRDLTRDLTRRNEIVWREVRNDLREMRAETTATLRDISDATRANTAGLLKVLDRLEPQGG